MFFGVLHRVALNHDFNETEGFTTVARGYGAASCAQNVPCQSSAACTPSPRALRS